MGDRELLFVVIRVFSGGARACAALLKTLSSYSGIALVLLADAPVRGVVQESAAVPAREIGGATPVTTGKIYWVPTGMPVRFENGALHRNRRAANGASSGDDLLVSIAREARARAVAAILPGIKAGCCVRGLNAIRAAGGLTFGAMEGKRTTVSRFVDFELPAEDIAIAIGHLASQLPRGRGAGIRTSSTELSGIETAATCHALFEATAQAVVAANRNGIILAANPHAIQIFGSERDELVGRPFESLLPRRLRGAHRLTWRACFGDLKTNTRKTGIEAKMCRKDGSEFAAEISLKRVGTARGPIALAFINDITERKEAEDQIRRNQQELRALNARLISVHEESRKLLARELHDAFTQQVAAVTRHVNGLQQRAAWFSSEIGTTLLQVRDEMNTVAANVRDFSRRLHPSILYDLGLLPALESECISFQRQYGIRVRFEKGAGVPERVPDQIGLTLYRIAQEAMRNAAQHASPRYVRLAVRMVDGELVLLVADKGRGFDVERARRKGGLGLISMEERARLVNGTLTANSRPGAGTTIEARVPLSRE